MGEKMILTRKEFVSLMRISEPKAQEILNSKDFYPAFRNRSQGDDKRTASPKMAERTVRTNI